MLDDENKPVKEGENGELTITTIGVEAMPLIRLSQKKILRNWFGNRMHIIQQNAINEWLT